jgi:hypothetical protein
MKIMSKPDEVVVGKPIEIEKPALIDPKKPILPTEANVKAFLTKAGMVAEAAKAKIVTPADAKRVLREACRVSEEQYQQATGRT